MNGDDEKKKSVSEGDLQRLLMNVLIEISIGVLRSFLEVPRKKAIAVLWLLLYSMKL